MRRALRNTKKALLWNLILKNTFVRIAHYTIANIEKQALFEFNVLIGKISLQSFNLRL